MSGRAVADTSMFIAREAGRALTPHVGHRELAISTVTIAELEIGVLAAAGPGVRSARLQTLRDAEQLSALPVDRTVASAFASLVVQMRAAGRAKLGVQDAWIAATAIAHDAELLTQDADFDGVPGLRVVKV